MTGDFGIHERRHNSSVQGRSRPADAFLYAKLGENDLLAFPDLVPGSIVRIDPRRGAERLPEAVGPSREIFLVEHDSILRCGRLQRNAKDRIVLCSVKFPFSRVELNSDPAFRIYGVVDAEMRPLARSSVFCQARAFVNAPSQRELRRIPSRKAALGEFIRLSRIRAGFSFREASALSRRIAEALADEMYFTAVGTLCEYETLVHPPRHVQKIISICILYNIGFWDLLTASGITVGPRAGDFMPDELIPRVIPDAYLSADEAVPEHAAKERPGFLATVVAEWSDIPLFAKDAFAFVAGLKVLSLSDVFWVGGDRNPIHPYLVHAAFVVVNSRFKKPIQTAAKTLWEQPLYMILKRDGGFLCGACTLEHGPALGPPISGPAICSPAAQKWNRRGGDWAGYGRSQTARLRSLGSVDAVTDDIAESRPGVRGSIDRPKVIALDYCIHRSVRGYFISEFLNAFFMRAFRFHHQMGYPAAYAATSLQRPVGLVYVGHVCLRTARRRHVSLIRRLIHLA